MESDEPTSEPEPTTAAGRPSGMSRRQQVCILAPKHEQDDGRAMKRRASATTMPSACTPVRACPSRRSGPDNAAGRAREIREANRLLTKCLAKRDKDSTLPGGKGE